MNSSILNKGQTANDDSLSSSNGKGNIVLISCGSLYV